MNILSQAEPGAATAPARTTAVLIGGRKTPGPTATRRCSSRQCRGQVPLALFLLDHGADPNIGDAGFTPLHWASTEWESFTANPVYGLDDAMSGIPDREAKLRLVNALLAHGANPNARMTKPQPPYRGRVSRTPSEQRLSSLASSADDLEMMQILLEAGADPKQATATNATAIMAATGLNHGIGESPVTEQQALAAVKFLLDLGVDPKGETTLQRERLVRPGISRLEHAARAIDRSRA